nr:immunoglobulin heavy chain junction region [Macaca mulatta]
CARDGLVVVLGGFW